MTSSKSSCVVVINLFYLLVGFRLFFHGFFPTKTEDSSRSQLSEVPPSWNREVDRLVILVIDALRADFVFDFEGGQQKHKIHYLQSLLENGDAVGFTTRVSPPTVTLPRIKSMMTGSIPGFMDVVNNFDAGELTIDSLVDQWTRAGRMVTLFGDDTWLRLFPRHFVRTDPTTSFFVSDYTEVDNNVTRHLAEELAKDDWDVMILHYLGLDHIGHLEGPMSDLVPAKLEEMGHVVKILLEGLSSRSDQLPGMIVVVGDHGMADGGGHGGTSVPEVLVPLVFVCPKCEMYKGSFRHTDSSDFHQVDIAPVLARLTGIPIPKWNLGRLIPLHLGSFEKSSPSLTNDPHWHRLARASSTKELNNLVALVYNAEQMATVVKTYGYSGESGIDLFHVAATSYSRLKDLPVETSEAEIEAEILVVQSQLTNALEKMQSFLIRSVVSYDYDLIILGLIVMLEGMLSLMSKQNENLLVYSLFCLCQSLLFAIGIIPHRILLLYILTKIVAQVPYLSGMFSNPFKLTSTNKLPKDDSAFIPFRLLLLFMLMLTLSLLSTSFVEEEHQPCYFFLASIFAYLLYSHISNATSVRTAVACILLCGIHRLLREFNRTGDKWRHLPDLADYLEMEQHELPVNCMFLLALTVTFGSVILESVRALRSKSALWKIILVMLNMALVSCVGIQKVAISNLAIKTTCSQYMYLLMIINFLVELCSNRLISYSLFHLTVYLTLTLRSKVDCICISLMIVMLRIFKQEVSNRYCRSNELSKRFSSESHALGLLTWLMARCSFFYLGNSNSLTTVDVGAGYTGVYNFSPVVVGFLLAVHTYSGPLLVIFHAALPLRADKCSGPLANSCPEESAADSAAFANDKVDRGQQLYYLFSGYSRMLCCQSFIFSLLCVAQRHHLFIWSVFSPKLLYLGMDLCVTTVAFSLIQGLFYAEYLFTGIQADKKSK